MANIAVTVRVLALERSQMAGQVRTLDKAISVLRKLGKGTRLALGAGGRKRRTISAAGRRRIAAAQRARWAKWKQGQKKAA